MSFTFCSPQPFAISSVSLLHPVPSSLHNFQFIGTTPVLSQSHRSSSVPLTHFNLSTFNPHLHN